MINLNDLITNYPKNLEDKPRAILREYLQCKILEIIFNSSFHSKLSFLGGTALRVIYDNQRFSEDLDFDNFDLSIEEFKELMKIIVNKLTQNGYEIEYDVSDKNAFRGNIKFINLLKNYDLAICDTEKLLIQIDTAPHHFKYSPDLKMLQRFDILTKINVTPLGLLLSQKIRALVGRHRVLGRDVYDIVFLLSKTKPNYEYLNDKLDIADSGKLKKELKGFFINIDMAQLQEDISNFIFDETDSSKLQEFKNNIENIEF